MSAVSQTYVDGAIANILSVMQSNYNTLLQKIQNNETRIAGALDAINTLRGQANDPVLGFNNINAGLREAYKDSQAHYSNEVDLAKWIGEIIVRNNLANPRAGTWNPQTGSFNPVLTNPGSGLQFPDILGPLRALGLGLGIGSGALLIGAAVLGYLILRK